MEILCYLMLQFIFERFEERPTPLPASRFSDFVQNVNFGEIA